MQKQREVNLDRFACLILCHGRPEFTRTYDTLRKYGYTGKIYIICDDEDKTLPGYIERFGADAVKIFNKDEALKLFDKMTSENKRSCAVYARNACWGIARELGLQYFCELDDDYHEFQWRYADGTMLRMVYPVALDDAFLEMINFLNTNENLYSVAFAQTGDFIGGQDSGNWRKFEKEGLIRKCMNTWICDVDKPFTFNGIMNDDVNTFTLYGSRGKLFYTIKDLSINQPDTQQVGGGMTAMYSGDGTYQKSWYTVLQCPSFVKVSTFRDNWSRIHHNIDWAHGMPKLISDKYKRR